MNIRTIFKTCIVVPAAMAALASCNTEQTEYFNAYLTAASIASSLAMKSISSPP